MTRDFLCDAFGIMDKQEYHFLIIQLAENSEGYTYVMTEGSKSKNQEENEVIKECMISAIEEFFEN